MKIFNFTRLASMLLAIGFFVSCSSSKFSVNSLVDEGNYDQAISELNAELQSNPSAELFYQKGKIHGLMAEDLQSDNRDDQYSSMLESFDSVSVYNSDSPTDFVAKSDSLVNYYWNLEHQSGLRAYQAENRSGFASAKAHFSNAMMIDPNLLDSYISLSIVQYDDENVDNAIATLEKTIPLDITNTRVYETLGFLYLEKGNATKSVDNYRKANQDPAENKNIAFGLVNAYLSNGQTSEAVSFLKTLVEKYPNEERLNNILGTQLYNQLVPLFSQLKRSYSDEDSSRVTNLRVEIEGISEQAESELIKAYQSDTSSIDYIESLGVFYNNMSGNYFSLIDVAFDSDKQDLINQALELTDFAINYYSKLSENSDMSSDYSEKIENLKELKNSWTSKE